MTDSLRVCDILKASLPESEARTVTLAIQQAESETSRDLKRAMDETWTRALQTFATKQEMAAMEVRLIRWMAAFWIGQTAVIIGTVVAVLRALK
jgi:hypothetical protein